MRVRKPLSLVTISALIAGLMLAVGANPAAAADKLTTNRDVETKMRCRASAPIIGAVDADQKVGINVTYPQYVEQGTDFDVITTNGPTEVPAEQSGITVISLRDIKTRLHFDGGFTIVSAAAVPGTGSYRVNASTPGPRSPAV